MVMQGAPGGRLKRLQAGGAVTPNGVYVERQEDGVICDLLRSGEYCNIVAAHQMGKTSLMANVARRLMRDGVRIAAADLSGLGGENTNQAESWYKNLFRRLAQDLRLTFDEHAWWSESPDDLLARRTQRFCDQFLVSETAQTVVFLDEVEASFDLPFTDEFFAAIRSLYESRSTDPKYGRLAFCLIRGLSPTEEIEGDLTMPYGVGRTVQLGAFDSGRDDLDPIAQALDCFGLDGQAVLLKILSQTGGHPFQTVVLASRAGELQSDAIEALVEAEIGS